MRTITINEENTKIWNGCREYIGSECITDGAEVSVEIAADLGWMWFSAISVRGYIRAEAGSGIKAGEGIEAGKGIEAGLGIEAGEGIKAGWGIEAGKGIKAGKGIEAGEGIKAGKGIEAGWGIEAGKGILCKWISTPLRIFAGICIWKIPNKNEIEIRCSEIRGGIIAYGELVLIEEKKHETNGGR